jgi:hypothetical protein
VIPALRAFFAVAAGLALVAGVLLFVLSEETDRFFSWTIQPPLTAAFLGAAYWAACVLFAWAARQRSWERGRLAVPPVLTVAVLLLVATLIHLDKFDFDSVFGWFWLVVYVVVPPLLVGLLWLQSRAPATRMPTRRDAPIWLRAVLAVQALVMLGVGVALFVAPSDADSLWPWTLTPLTARAVGTFLVGLGVAAAHACAEGDLGRIRGAAAAYALLGALELVAALRYGDDLTGGAAEPLYLAFAASALAVGTYGLLARAASASPRS